MKKNTKKSLLLSVLALVLCTAMLLGTTFAWFTDSASTAVNKIEAGTLDIQLLDANNESLEGKTLAWQKAADHENDPVLWEPGCTYNLQSFKIRNNGNLKLKYEIAITGIVGDADLLPAIDFTVSNFTGAATAATLNGYQGSLEPNSETGLITITGKMKTEAGNVYQGKSIDGIGITVRAAQLGGTFAGVNGEYDSNGNTYDENAPYCEWPVFVTQAPAKDENGNPTDQTLTKYVSDDIQAEVYIPAAAVNTDATQLILKVEKTTAPANFTVGAGQDSKTYEVKVEGLKENNDTPIKAKIFVGIGLTNVTLTHNDDETFNDVGSSTNFTGEDKTFYYDVTDGYIYFASKTFSPFSAAYAAPVGISGAGTMKETYYPTAEAAQAAADNGTVVTAVQTVENVQVGGSTETVEKGQTFKVPAAEYNETKYYSVAEAVQARGTSGSNKTITILNDITEDISLRGYTTLALNGKTVTGNISIKDYDAIENGTVTGTVTDNTKAAPSNNDKNRIVNCTVTKFVLADGCNRENVLIKDSTIGEVIVGNRYYSSGSAGLLTFENCHVTGNITVGTNVCPYTGSMGSGWGFGSKVRFVGGTYDGTLSLVEAETYHNVIDIVTGTFANSVPQEFLNSASAIREEGGKYIAYKLPSAKVGQTEYDTIEGACAAAMAGDDNRVTILCDGNIETTVEVTGTLVLDLNGHTVQAAPPHNRAFYIMENGNLTIEDSSAEKVGLLESVSSSNAETIYFKGGNSSLTVNGGTVKSPSKAITANSNVKAPYSITVNGGKIWSTGNSAISLNAYAPVTFTMKGGNIEGNSYSGTIFTGTYGTGTHTFNFFGGTINRKGSYNLNVSAGDGVTTVVNIASGMDVKCNNHSTITVNNNYSEN